ncbi:MAG: hypothetical protein NW205_04315 [Hyphomicrobiaceae bacterium]|nr:hypothetical protein [Hyphomicrobiaceae bacterium]
MSRSASTAEGLKSSLLPVKNDTGRIAFCGPYILSALTGYPISRVEAEINRHRNLPADAHIEGTWPEEVAAAASALGYTMTLVADYLHLDRKDCPTLWSWMQKPRNAWRYYLLAIHTGKEAHWILIKGVKICDTYTQGQWKFVCDGPHRGRRIFWIFEIAPSHGVAAPVDGIMSRSAPKETPARPPLSADLASGSQARAGQSFARST